MTTTYLVNGARLTATRIAEITCMSRTAVVKRIKLGYRGDQLLASTHALRNVEPSWDVSGDRGKPHRETTYFQDRQYYENSQMSYKRNKAQADACTRVGNDRKAKEFYAKAEASRRKMLAHEARLAERQRLQEEREALGLPPPVDRATLNAKLRKVAEAKRLADAIAERQARNPTRQGHVELEYAKADVREAKMMPITKSDCLTNSNVLWVEVQEGDDE